MEEMNWLDWMLANWETSIVVIVMGVITIASTIVKLTPTEVDDVWLYKILKLLEKLGLNNKPVELKKK